MTKQEFIAKVSDRSGLSNRDAGKAVDAFMEVVTEGLKSGDSINFTGFGKFSAAARAARQGVNPRTGERVDLYAEDGSMVSVADGTAEAARLLPLAHELLASTR